MKKIIFLCLSLNIDLCIAQDTSLSDGTSVKSEETIIFSLVPQHLIVNGLRFDIEKNIKNTNNWVLIAPQFYLNHNDYDRDNFPSYYRNNNDYDIMTGYGIDIYHKLFLKEQAQPKGPYFAYGLSYQHYLIEFRQYTWDTFTDDGLEYYSYDLLNCEETINKVGLNMMIGLQNVVERFVIDIYLGMGIRYSFIETNAPETRTFYRYWWHFGYTGTLPLFGFRLGMML